MTYLPVNENSMRTEQEIADEEIAELDAENSLLDAADEDDLLEEMGL